MQFSNLWVFQDLRKDFFQAWFLDYTNMMTFLLVSPHVCPRAFLQSNAGLQVKDFLHSMTVCFLKLQMLCNVFQMRKMFSFLLFTSVG